MMMMMITASVSHCHLYGSACVICQLNEGPIPGRIGDTDDPARTCEAEANKTCIEASSIHRC